MHNILFIHFLSDDHLKAARADSDNQFTFFFMIRTPAIQNFQLPQHLCFLSHVPSFQKLSNAGVIILNLQMRKSRLREASDLRMVLPSEWDATSTQLGPPRSRVRPSLGPPSALGLLVPLRLTLQGPQGCVSAVFSLELWRSPCWSRPSELICSWCCPAAFNSLLFHTQFRFGRNRGSSLRFSFPSEKS